MVDFKPIKKKTRFGFMIYVCPRCGHVFRKISNYNRHVAKSHGNLLFEKNNDNVQ